MFHPLFRISWPSAAPYPCPSKNASKPVSLVFSELAPAAYMFQVILFTDKTRTGHEASTPVRVRKGSLRATQTNGSDSELN
jgi:hypothetical protein